MSARDTIIELLDDDETAAFFVELWVLLDAVKGLAFGFFPFFSGYLIDSPSRFRNLIFQGVGGYFAAISPRPEGCVRLKKPDFAEPGGSKLFLLQADPALTIIVPIDSCAVRLDWLACLPISQPKPRFAWLVMPSLDKFIKVIGDGIGILFPKPLQAAITIAVKLGVL